MGPYARRLKPDLRLFSLEDPTGRFTRLLGGPQSKSGVRVTETTAMALPAVWCAVMFYSWVMASMPFKVYRRRKGGGKDEAPDHPLNPVISREPTRSMTSFVWREATQAHICTRGDGFARIFRNRFAEVERFQFLNPWDLTPILRDDDELIYKITKTGETLSQWDIIHIPWFGWNGERGLSPIRTHMETIGLGMATTEFAARLYGSGANMSGVLETDKKFRDQEQKNALRAQFEENYHGLAGSGKTLVLDQGMQYKRIAIPPNELQYIERIRATTEDIARIYMLPPHVLKELSRATNNNIEHQGIEAAIYSIMPMAVRWEQEINRKCFREDEKDEYYVHFNMDAFLRGDVRARWEAYRKGFETGALSPNDILEKEDMNPFSGGEQHFVPKNFVPIQHAGREEKGTRTNGQHQTNGHHA